MANQHVSLRREQKADNTEQIDFFFKVKVFLLSTKGGFLLFFFNQSSVLFVQNSQYLGKMCTQSAIWPTPLKSDLKQASYKNLGCYQYNVN